MFTHHTYPLKALGEYFLTGEYNLSSFSVVHDTIMEGTKKLACYKTKPEDGRKWFGEWMNGAQDSQQ